jgi:hypothetical protein
MKQPGEEHLRCLSLQNCIFRLSWALTEGLILGLTAIVGNPPVWGRKFGSFSGLNHDNQKCLQTLLSLPRGRRGVTIALG